MQTMRTKEKQLKLMYITNDPSVAKIAEEAGVDRIFVDMEVLDKEKRQPGLDTVKSCHTTEDVGRLRKVLTRAELLVRVNHIYDGSEEEIRESIRQGADIVMLPYFKTVEEVKRFIAAVDGQAKTSLLLETPEAVEVLDEILALPGIDEIHVGLNDLHLGYNRKFMFELLADGTVDIICAKCRKAGIPYGFGGIASLGKGAVPADYIIKEHYRLGSGITILSRSFCNTSVITDLEDIREIFETGVAVIRAFEAEVRGHWAYFEDNRQTLQNAVAQVVAAKSEV